MRLICGFVRLDGAAADAHDLEKMVAALIPSGIPSTIARHLSGPVALAVLSCDPQGPAPRVIVLPSGRLVAADVRLDDPITLSCALSVPVDSGDDVLLAHALQSWGEAVPDRVGGDFAGVMWDPQRRSLLLVRDCMGTRPLCYGGQPGRLFAFASLPHGLQQAGLMPVTPDMERLVSHAAALRRSHTITAYREIDWLRPGHALEASDGRQRIHQAWRPHSAQIGKWRGAPTEAAATLRQLIVQAVACRLPKNGPVGTYLSSGLDSGAVSCIAAEQLRHDGRQLHAYSFVADPARNWLGPDESALVGTIRERHPDMVWHPIHAAMQGAQEFRDPNIPFAMFDYQPFTAACARARASSIHCLLTGSGGDEAASYNGAAPYASLLRMGRWRHVLHEIPARGAVEGESVGRAALMRLVLPFLRGLRTHRTTVSTTQPLYYLRPAWLEIAQSAMVQPVCQGNGPKHRIAGLTESYLIARATDWSLIGARYGVALTHPLLDRRVVDFALSLPLESHLQNGYARAVFRTAMAGILPDPVRLATRKLAPFSDLPSLMADDAVQMLSRIDRLAASPVSEVFALDRLRRVIGQMLSPSWQHVSDCPAAGPLRAMSVPPGYLEAIAAVQALNAAEHIDHTIAERSESF